MKDVYNVFEENLKFIVDIMNSSNIRNCFKITIDLTVYSSMADYDDGVLISEILEGVFYDIGSLFDEFEVDDKDKMRIVDELKTQINNILINYKSDRNKLFLSLKKLRFEATKFQLKIWNLAKRKPATNISD